MRTIEVKNVLDFVDLRDECWSGAIDTLNTVYNHDKEEDLMWLIEEEFCGEIPTMTEVNDFLRFEDEYIFDRLGIDEDEEEDEGEE